MKVDYKKIRQQIPTSVQLGRTKKSHYEVLWSEGFSHESTMGETTFDKKQIRIKTGMNDKDTVTTYIHELLHAASNETGANLTETQILALEQSFYYILKLNNILITSKE